MGKFKVGDMVRIIDTILNNQEKYKGEVHRILKLDNMGDYILSNMPHGNTVWKDEELELVSRFEDDYSLDATRYCISDLIMTNNCCEEIKEEKNMNKVVTLWYERKRKSIEKKYDKLREEFGEKQYSVIESFNELVEQFNKDLDGLFQFDKASEQFVLKENAPSNVYKYKIDYDKLRDEFVDKYIKKRNKELNKVEEEYAEIKAQLSLSDDLDYQIEILNRYGILNKKTKKISD